MINQNLIVAIIFCIIAIAILIKQSLIYKRFLKGRILLLALLTFLTTLIIFFYGEVDDTIKNIFDWTLIAIEVVIGIIIFLTFDYSIFRQKYQFELTKSLDESKLYVVLDKKEKIKEMSSLLLKDLNLEFSECHGKNFFDILEAKYRIIGFNDQECYKDDIKKYYYHYEKKVNPDGKNKIELILQDDHAKESAMHFFESLIYKGKSYKGRILIGELKNEDNLIGIEKDLASASSELEIIKNRFVTLLQKTNEGVFFNNLTDGYIWCNDTLVKKLSLNGNSLDTNSFYKQIHPDDIALYKESLSNLKATDYSISYRFNTGTNYIYIKEEGRKLVIGKNIELCGIMTPLDDYKFSKTDTILDNIYGEPEMLQRLDMLERGEKIFEVVYFRVDSIPEINETLGRAIGNTMLSQYVQFFKQNFVTDNQIYRISGLEFVAFVTDYRKMDMLKNNLVNGEKMLHVHADYLNQKVDAEVFMGISRSDDLPSHKDTLKNAKEALKFASNPKFSSNFAFYKDIR